MLMVSLNHLGTYTTERDRWPFLPREQQFCWYGNKSINKGQLHVFMVWSTPSHVQPAHRSLGGREKDTRFAGH